MTECALDRAPRMSQGKLFFYIPFWVNLLTRLIFAAVQEYEFTSHQCLLIYNILPANHRDRAVSTHLSRNSVVFGVRSGYLWRPLVVWRPCGRAVKGNSGRQQHCFTVGGCWERLWLQVGLLFHHHSFLNCSTTFFLRERNYTSVHTFWRKWWLQKNKWLLKPHICTFYKKYKMKRPLPHLVFSMFCLYLAAAVSNNRLLVTEFLGFLCSGLKLSCGFYSVSLKRPFRCETILTTLEMLL